MTKVRVAGAWVLVATLVAAILAGGGGTPAFPVATNTGVPSGTTLTTVTGEQDINTDGTVYQDKLVNGGCIIVHANNVTIKNVKIIEDSACGSGILNDPGCCAPSGTNLTVQDVTIDCRGTADNAVDRTGISSQSFTATRVDFGGGCGNAVFCDHDCDLEDSYVHDMVAYDPVRDPHTDGFQGPETGGSNITINHNTIYGDFRYPLAAQGGTDDNGFGSSAVQIKGCSHCAITNNKLSGAGYSLRCQAGTGNTFYTVTGNRITNAPEAAVGWPNFYAGFGGEDGFCGTYATTYSDNSYLDGPLAGQPLE